MIFQKGTAMRLYWYNTYIGLGAASANNGCGLDNDKISKCTCDKISL